MFRVLYDVRSAFPIDPWWAAFGALFMCFGITNLIVNWKGKRISPVMFAALPTIWTLCVVGGPYLNWRHNIGLLQSGNYQIAQGFVQSFCSEKDGKLEEFTVGGHAFSYSHYELLGRFNAVRAFGGTVRSGQYLKITFVDDDDIVRLEERTDRSLRMPSKVQLAELCY